MKTLCLLLAFTSPALAGSIVFGSSWDGNPPGTFMDLTGEASFNAGLPDFQAGTWLITVEGGYSAWYGRDIVGWESAAPCPVLTCTLSKPASGEPASGLQIYPTAPWRLWATTPSFTHQTSNGPQFAFTQTSQTSWRWGLEDISLGVSDNDYQDIYGTIRKLGEPDPIPTPQCVNCDPVPTPVPEPSSLWLMGVGMLFLARHGR